MNTSPLATLILSSTSRACVIRSASMGADRLWQAAICVPARDEEQRIVNCLAAAEVALSSSALSGGIVMLVNNSRDRSYELAARWLAHCQLPHVIADVAFHSQLAHAGMARKLAVELGAALVRRDGLLLTTDADSTVERNWVTATVAAMSRGADVIYGAIEPSEDESGGLRQSLRRELAWERDYARLTLELNGLINTAPELPWPHRSNAGGASLAFRCVTFDDIGGIPAIPCGEDRAFADAAMARDWRVQYAADVRVTTSCRQYGRARGGMADTIAARQASMNVFADDILEPGLLALRRARARIALRRCWLEGRSGMDVQARLGISREDATDFAQAGHFGQAWQRTETLSPALASRQMTLASLAQELPRLRRLLQRQRRLLTDYRAPSHG